MVLKIERTYRNGRSYWTEQRRDDFKVQCPQKFARIILLQVIDIISALLQTLYLKGYSRLQKTKKDKSPSKRKLFAISNPPPPTRARNIKRDGKDNVNSVFIAEKHGCHIHEGKGEKLASHCTTVIAWNNCIKSNSAIIELTKKLQEKEK